MTRSGLARRADADALRDAGREVVDEYVLECSNVARHQVGRTRMEAGDASVG